MATLDRIIEKALDRLVAAQERQAMAQRDIADALMAMAPPAVSYARAPHNAGTGGVKIQPAPIPPRKPGGFYG